MTIKFHKDQHVDVIMWVSPPGAGFDALFVIHVPNPGEPRRMDWRFRYDGPPEEKRWYSVVEKTPQGPEKLKLMAEILAKQATMMFGKVALEVIDCDCDGETAGKMLLEKAWANPMATGKAPGGVQ